MFHGSIEHYLQRDILRRLSYRPQLAFSDLRPAGIENGTFAYHLKQLVIDGLVHKQDDTYTLSTDGLAYVARATRTNLDIAAQPRIFCLLIIQNDSGEYLLHRRHAQPFVGSYTFPGGALMYDESLGELVRWQLLEKVGFEIPLEHRGIAKVLYKQDGTVVLHNYHHLLYGTVTGRLDVQSKDTRFTPEWIQPDAIPKSELMPDIPQLLDRIASEQHYFYIELNLPA